MDYITAQSLLEKLPGHLLIEWWWLLHQKEEDELGLAKAFGCPRAQIEAHLVNTGVYKEMGHGITIIMNVWESFCTNLNTPSKPDQKAGSSTWKMLSQHCIRHRPSR